MSKEKKITFSTEIDSAINGYAIGISFLGIGIFLLLKPDYFFKPILSYMVGAIIGAFGVMGTGVELSKSSKIKGMDNLSIGLVIFAIWLVAYIKISALWANILFFVLLIVGVYAICLGLIQAIFSVIRNIKSRKATNPGEEKYSIGNIISQITLLLTQLCALTVAIFNILNAVKL